MGPTKRGRFVVHCHDASRLHYDLRIQVGGVLESFAIPKGPSVRLDDKRLAVHTEAHPLRYLDFEGVIPEGNYGAGAMIVWDRGRVSYPKDTAEEGLEKGALSIDLDGFKLKGRFSLVRPKSSVDDTDAWLLIKRDDAFASDEDITDEKPRSVLSGMTVEELSEAPELYQAVIEEAKKLGAERDEVLASKLTPMLATLDDAPVDRPGWVYELKLDGVRILAERRGSEARLFYRTGRQATASFPEVVEGLRSLLAEDVILDGEIITFDDVGKPSFQRLGRRIHATKAGDIRFLRDTVPVVFVVFDVIALGGYDLRSLSLLERKALLERVLPGGKGVLRRLDYFEDDGTALLAFCDAQKLEGVVAKKSDSPYRPGPSRNADWLKIKRLRENDFLVHGYTKGKGGRSQLGALEIGSYVDGEMVSRGRVGSGLSDAEVERLLPSLERGDPLVVRVRYAGFTEDGNLRHPVYLGVRHDVAPDDIVVLPKPDDATMLAGEPTTSSADRVVGKAKLTNQAKVFWPQDGITKGDLCNYYEAISPVLLPYLKDRPVTLVRFPDGIEGKSFFQWRIPKHAPAWVQSLPLRSEEQDGKEVNTILVNDLSTLMYVVNLGCIPIHVIASHADALDTCDFLTLDLDVELASLREAVPIALSIRDILDEVQLEGFPKTSGKTGLHVIVPLGDGLPFEVAKQLLELIGRIALQRHPDTATMERRKDKRGDRVLIDVGQTGRLRTIVAPYSVREVAGAPVSTPLSWDEVSLSLDPRAFNVFTVPDRVLSIGDPMAPAAEVAIDLEATLSRLGTLVSGA
jgi:bifunctional non-homologous end joining protein LigD